MTHTQTHTRANALEWRQEYKAKDGKHWNISRRQKRWQPGCFPACGHLPEKGEEVGDYKRCKHCRTRIKSANKTYNSTDYGKKKKNCERQKNPAGIKAQKKYRKTEKRKVSRNHYYHVHKDDPEYKLRNGLVSLAAALVSGRGTTSPKFVKVPSFSSERKFIDHLHLKASIDGTFEFKGYGSTLGHQPQNPPVQVRLHERRRCQAVLEPCQCDRRMPKGKQGGIQPHRPIRSRESPGRVLAGCVGGFNSCVNKPDSPLPASCRGWSRCCSRRSFASPPPPAGRNTDPLGSRSAGTSRRCTQRLRSCP